MKPKISVLIPVYNAERFLSNCLESVISQTLSEVEIICVDDASKDNSRQILEKYARKDERIKLIFHEKNLGILAARKHGVKIATGSYIMFLDSDDELFLDACSIAYKAIEQNQTDAVQFAVQEIDSEGNFTTTPKILLTEDSERIEDENWLYMLDKGKIKGWTIWNKVYKADLCKNILKQMEDDYFVMAEDVYFFFVYGYYANSYSSIGNVLYKYRQGFGIWSGIQKEIGLEKYKILLEEKKVLDAILRFYESKQDKRFETIIQKHVKDVFLKQTISWWYNNLRYSVKTSGLQMLMETWANIDFAFITTLLSEIQKPVQHLQKYITARLDIKNFGTEGNKVEVIESSDNNANIQSPVWFKNAQGQGVVVHSYKGDMQLKIKCGGNGALEIALRGMDCRDKNNKRFPVWIDYKKLKVKGADIFASSHVVWHDKPFKHRLNVADGEMVTIDVEWKAVDNTSEYLP